MHFCIIFQTQNIKGYCFQITNFNPQLNALVCQFCMRERERESEGGGGGVKL